jgi:transposase
MLRWISIVGGLLIMMGQHARSEALFYYFRLEDQIPETHLLRLIDRHISFEFVRQQLRDSYSDTGRPSVDPELLLRILLIGYLYGITSERKLVEELRMHLAWRWFTGLGFDQEIPHHSTFSKNRHGRFQESKLFEQLFEQIVRQCVEVGLVQGKHLSVDGSFVEAHAAKQNRIPREQLAEAAQVHHTVRQYLKEVEAQKPVEAPVHEQDQVSTTDPDSTYATKGGTPARLGYYDNYLVDNDSCVIVGVQATAARMSQETVAAQDMLTRFSAWQGREPATVAADTTYGNGEFFTGVGGSQYYSVYADPRQHPPQEQPFFWSRAFYLSARTQSLHVSRRPGAQLRWSSLSESCLQLHRNPQTLWCVCAKSPMHQRPFSISEHPPTRTRPTTRTGVSQHARVCSGPATEKEGGSAVRRTEKSDRAASPAPAEIEVCAGAVLPGCRCTEPQALSPVPQPPDKTHSGS